MLHTHCPATAGPVAAAALALLCSFSNESTPPNVVVIVTDDFGVDLVGAYAESNNPPCTPSMDQLAADGILFRNAYATPTCLSTRAALMTGRFGFRTGIGSVGGGGFLSQHELTIAEALTTYESHAIGKWHIGSDPLDAQNQGFARWAGFTGGGVGQSYYNWTRWESGVSNQETTYSTTVLTDDAITSLGTMQEPWFLYVAYNAPHSPLEAPPVSLCVPPSECPTPSCGNLGGNPSNPDYTRAMVEALDTELGRLLDAVALEDPNAYVMFIGDNGTAKSSALTPFLSSHGKGEVYDGGVNVPFLVKGPGVAQGESAGLISIVDVFATLTELAGLPADSATDSVSLVPYFSNPAQSLRTALYAESYSANNTPAPFGDHQQVVTDGQYKLIRRAAQGDEFFYLPQDLFETNNLLPNLSVGEQLAFDALEIELNALTTTPPIAYCTAGASASGCQGSVHAIGTASASASAGFTLAVQNIESGRPGLFFFGANGRQASPWGNGTSYQCVVPPVKRTPLQSAAGGGGSCDGAHALDLQAHWGPGGPGAVKNPGSGALVQAQFWYRDPASTSNQTTSLSNGFEFVVGP